MKNYWKKRAELAEKALLTNEVQDWKNWQMFKNTPVPNEKCTTCKVNLLEVVENKNVEV